MANTETVEIIIEGTDKSAAAFTSATGNTKALTNQAKDGAEGIQKLARLMGAGPFMDFASGIKEGAESLQKMVAGMKGGGIAAAGLKAGMAGLAVAGGFKVGQMIDEWILGTKQWREELEATMAAAGKTADMLINKREKQFDLALAELDIIQNAEEKRAGELALLEKIRGEIEEGKDALAAAKEEQEAIENSWANTFGYADEAKKIAEQHVGIEQERLDVLKEQEKAVAARTGERADRMAETKKVQGSQSYIAELQTREKLAGMSEEEAAVFQAREKAHGDADKAEAERATRSMFSIERAKKANEEYAKTFDELGNAFDDAFAAQEDKDWGVIENLQLAQVELEQGEEAAHRMSLAMQGISQPAIDAAVAIRQQNKALEEQKRVKDSILGDAGSIMQRMLDDAGKAAPSLSAKESRFLTRGTAGGDPMAKMALTTEQMKEIAKRSLIEAQENRKASERIEKAIDVAYAEVGP